MVRPELRAQLEKLSWLELAVPVEGATKALSEKVIRRAVRAGVIPSPKQEEHTDAVYTQQHPTKVPNDEDQFPTKVSSFMAKYERR